mgnify:CR=1 FL=1
MTRIILCGCCGKMGHFITQLVSERTDCEIVAGVDLNVNAQTASYPAYTSIDQVTEAADVVIDFSHPSLLTPILHYAAEKGGIPAVLCTTGYTAEQTAELTKASETQPIFYSRNMSLGINLMLELAKKLSENIPFLRVDFYIIEHKVYFSELTFFPASGFERFVPDEWDDILGSWLKLPPFLASK